MPRNFVVRYVSKYHTDKPIFLTEDLGERVSKYLKGGGYFSGRPYLTMWKRDFLIGNQIYFPPLRVHEDQIYGINCLFLARKILRVPNICCIHRERADSISYELIGLQYDLHKFMRVYIDGFNALKNILDSIEFFDEHPDYRYALLNGFIIKKLYLLENLYAQMPFSAINPLVEKEFHSDDTSFAAYLFNTVNVQRLQIAQLKQENIALRNELKKYQTVR